MKKSIILLSILFTCLVSCDSNGTFEDIELPFDGLVVYVEDLTGENGLLANPFGDLVMLDGNNNTKQIITNDGYYYAYPNLSLDKQSIIFESKRDRNIIISGLGAISNIYKYHFETKEIKKYWDIIYDKTGFELGESMKSPSISPSGQKLAMIHTHYGKSNFMAIDFVNNEILQITNDRAKRPLTRSNISWSPNEDYLLIEPPTFFSSRPVLLFNFNTSEFISITYPYPDILEKGKAYLCKPGTWINYHSFYYSCSIPSSNTQIFKYSLADSSSTEIISIEGLRVMSLQANPSNNELLFIGGKENYRHDLYLLKLDSEELIRLTYDERQKGWMRWYPNN